MHAEVNWNDNVINCKDIYTSCPTSNRRMSPADYFRIEEGIERMYFWIVVQSSSFFQQFHVEVYNLWWSKENLEYINLNILYYIHVGKLIMAIVRLVTFLTHFIVQPIQAGKCLHILTSYLDFESFTKYFSSWMWT